MRDVTAWMMCETRGDDVTGGIDAARMTFIGLSFRSGIPPIFAENLTKAMAEEKWKSAATPAAVAEDLPKGVDPNNVQQLIEMGFGRNRAIRALMATANRSVPKAMDWAIAFQHDTSADAPLNETETTEGRRKIIKSGLGDIFKREEEKQKQTTKSPIHSTRPHMRPAFAERSTTPFRISIR